MVGYTIVAAAVFLVGKVTSTFLPGNILGVLQDIGFLALTVSVVYYAINGFNLLRRRLFWKVRNRIIAAFAVVGFLPLVVLLIFSSFALYLISQRLSNFYLQSELQQISSTLDEAGRQTVVTYLKTRDSSTEHLKESARNGLRRIPFGLKDTVCHIYKASPGVSGSYSWIASVAAAEGAPIREAPAISRWVQSGFSGLTLDAGSLNFTGVFDPDGETRFLLQMPFDSVTFDYLRRRTSLELLLTQSTPRDNPAAFERAYATVSDIKRQGLAVRGVHFFRPVDWATGEPGDYWSIAFSLPIRVLLEYFFQQEVRFLVLIAAILIGTFFLIEIFSLVVGVLIARRITRSIYNIYSAVQSIQGGDFNVRIPSGHRDQLDNVADSVNNMSSSIVHLLQEVSRREALEKELEIAKEVQIQLFPQLIPTVNRLAISAICRPARQVSGDYYDFLVQNSDHVDIVIGDISGKGISAALLMASLQSTIRNGLSETDGEPRERIARVAHKVNRQLYRRSSPESYSTLVLNHWDAEGRRLYYCNAGHHPPLCFSKGEVRGLTVGGTVVGLFESWHFEAGEVQLSPGDVVLYFTDGVVEAANAEGEQFGTERLIELVQPNLFLTPEDIQELILEQIFSWSEGEEQADDITVLCLRVTG
jgi:sigma-B regulation protein RsbU (phosphoserine phosphatase)